MQNLEELSLEKRMELAEKIANSEARWPRPKRFWRRVKGPIAASIACGLALFVADESIGDKVIRGFCTELSEVAKSYWEEYSPRTLDREPYTFCIFSDTSGMRLPYYTMAEDAETLLFEYGRPLNITRKQEKLPLVKEWINREISIYPRGIVKVKEGFAPFSIIGYEKLKHLPVSIPLPLVSSECEIKKNEVKYQLSDWSFSPSKERIAYVLDFYAKRDESWDYDDNLSVNEYRNRHILEIYNLKERTVEKHLEFNNGNIIQSDIDINWLNNQTLIVSDCVMNKEHENNLNIYTLNTNGKRHDIIKNVKAWLPRICRSPCGEKFLLVFSFLEQNLIVCDLNGVITKIDTRVSHGNDLAFGFQFDAKGKGVYYAKKKSDFKREILLPEPLADILGLSTVLPQGNLNDYRVQFELNKSSQSGITICYRQFGFFDREIEIVKTKWNTDWSPCKDGILLLNRISPSDDRWEDVFRKVDFDPDKDY